MNTQAISDSIEVLSIANRKLNERRDYIQRYLRVVASPELQNELTKTVNLLNKIATQLLRLEQAKLGLPIETEEIPYPKAA